MISGETTKGFVWEFDERVLDDIEILDAISEMDENPMVFPKLVKKILGEEQKKAFYDAYRNEDGRVPVEELVLAFGEILTGNPETKK